MKFFSRRSEPLGLYRQDKPPAEMEAERRKIRDHNVSVLLAAEKKIRETPLFFSNNPEFSGAPIPLPDLWCNSSDRRDNQRDRFSLVFITQEPEREGTIVAKLSITDVAKKQLAAIRAWKFMMIDGKYVRVTSSVDTTLGYEGNGYATALMRLNNAVVEPVIAAVLVDSQFYLNRHGRNLHWFSVASDAAVTASEDDYRLPRRDDVPASRKNWTADIVRTHLSDFTADKQEVERRLGFVPHDVEYRQGDFFKVYR